MSAITELDPITIVSNDVRANNFNNILLNIVKIKSSDTSSVTENFQRVIIPIISQDASNPHTGLNVGNVSVSSTKGEVTGASIISRGGPITFNLLYKSLAIQSSDITGLGADQQDAHFTLGTVLPVVSNNIASSTSVEMGKLKIMSQLFLRPAGATGGYGDGGTAVTQTQRWF